MENLQISASQIIAYLRSSCGLVDLKLDSQVFNVDFDALLIGADPLNVVAVEGKANASEQSLRQSIRKAKTFAWSAHANNKLALLSLVIIVPEDPSPEISKAVESELSGTARVFLISERMSMEEIARRLSLLTNPRFTHDSVHLAISGTLESMLGDFDNGVLVQIMEETGLGDNLSVRLSDRLQSLAEEVDRAIDEA